MSPVPYQSDVTDVEYLNAIDVLADPTDGIVEETIRIVFKSRSTFPEAQCGGEQQVGRPPGSQRVAPNQRRTRH